MVSAVASEKLTANLKLESFDFDPGVTTKVDIVYKDMRDFGTFLATFVRTIGTSVVTFEIFAATDAAGAGAVVVKTALFAAGQPDAVGDTVVLEATAEELQALGTGLRFLTATVSVATGSDEAVINYIRGNPRFHQQNLTVDVIA